MQRNSDAAAGELKSSQALQGLELLSAPQLSPGKGAVEVPPPDEEEDVFRSSLGPPEATANAAAVEAMIAARIARGRMALHRLDLNLSGFGLHRRRPKAQHK